MTTERGETSKRGDRLRRSVMVVGVGGAGGNIAAELQSIGALDGLGFNVQWINLCTDPPHGRDNISLHSVPVATTFLASTGSGGSARLVPAFVHKQRYRFRALVAGVEIVVLVAGLGGGTGGGMALYFARLARNVRTLTIAFVTMPFGFEGIRVQRADIAIKRLKRTTARVIAFSNQQLADEMGDNAMLDTIYEVQSMRIARFMRHLLRRQYFG